MTSEKIIIEINLEWIIYKQIDVSSECVDKGGEINIFYSEITIHNYHF